MAQERAPRAELHCHLDGALRPATAAILARDLGIDRELRLVAPATCCASQSEYLRYFDDALLVLQTEAALERAARELCEDAAADGTDYLEIRWAPRLHLSRGLSVEQVIDAVLRGIASGPLRGRAIVCAMRQHRPEENVALARAAGAAAGRGVVGFDLAGPEEFYPAAPHRPAFEAARAAGLHLTCHAGEGGPPANVLEALSLGVERIAHGVLGMRDPEVVRRVVESGVVLDMCPTANLRCAAVPSLAAHPLRAALRAGVRCTISTDSPTVAATTLTREFRLARDEIGLTEADLQACERAAREAAFDR